MSILFLSQSGQDLLSKQWNAAKQWKATFASSLIFLASMNSDSYVNNTRPSSGVPLQLPVQRIHVYVTVSGEAGLNKHTHCANNSTPRRRKSQPVIRDRKETGSEALFGHRCNFGFVLTEDFGNEIWSSLQKKECL